MSDDQKDPGGCCEDRTAAECDEAHKLPDVGVIGCMTIVNPPPEEQRVFRLYEDFGQKLLIEFYADGHTVCGPTYTPDKAAQVFWSHVVNPWQQAARAVEEAKQTKAKLEGQVNELQATVTTILKWRDEYAARTAAVSYGAEDHVRGASIYNWMIGFLRELDQVLSEAKARV